MLNNLPNWPRRGWRKITDPGLSSLMARAVPSRMGARTTRTIAPSPRSVAVLTTRWYGGSGGVCRIGVSLEAAAAAAPLKAAKAGRSGIRRIVAGMKRS